MTFNMLVALVSAVCLFSCGASLLGLYWSIVARAQRHRAAMVSCCVAPLIAYLGLSRLHLRASKTVNGRLEWSLDSGWFFIGALVLGGAALVLTLWKWRQARQVASPADRSVLDGAAIRA
jgi:protein-S-isoprenylcysteine O-methyltransferase Ste14